MAKEENLKERIRFKININNKNIQNKYDYISQLVDMTRRDLDDIMNNMDNGVRNDILAYKVRDAGIEILNKYEEIRQTEEESRFLRELIREEDL